MLKLEITMPARYSPDKLTFTVRDLMNAYSIINDLADLNPNATFKIYNADEPAEAEKINNTEEN